MTSAQCRAARAILNLEQGELAKLADVHRNTIMDFEREVRRPRASTVAVIRAALEKVGIEFIEENGGGPGLRLAIPTKSVNQRQDRDA